MDSIEIATLSIVALLGLIGLKVPIGVALIVVSFVGIWVSTSMGAAWGLTRAVPFNFVAKWEFSAVPMFLLMGYIASNAGLTTAMFTAMRLLLNRLPGGLACATVGASSMFAAASGSSIATSAAMARIAIPEMSRAKYDLSLSTGSVASAGTLGSMIPPSIAMVIYGVFTDTSIGKLFIAGVIPGLLSALMFVVMIVIRVRLKPSLAPREHVARVWSPELKAALKEIWPLPTLILCVLGGIFAGLMTPTEAGAVGAFVAILITLYRGVFSIALMRGALRDAAIGTSTIFLIAIGASMFTAYMGLSGLPATVSQGLLDTVESPITLILIIAAVCLIGGMFLDSIGLMLLTLPFFIPVLQGADIDFIWFGIIMVKLLEIGLITPPVGLNCYVIQSAMGKSVPLSTVFRGAGWFVATDLVTLSLLISFPILALWLPGLMG